MPSQMCVKEQNVSISSFHTSTRRPHTTRVTPSREQELVLLASMRERGLPPVLAAVDEVGRGALAGPVSVGIVIVNDNRGEIPEGLRDSKMLSEAAREALVPACEAWALAGAVGHASSKIVDEYGIVAALRFAACEAVRELAGRGYHPTEVLLDGSHNWWDANSLFDPTQLPNIPVHMQVKADASCAAVAAASVLAKVERDHLMRELELEYPGYDWARNKGYSSPRHIEALKRRGPSPQHRVSWHLPGVEEKNR